jgi:hypothetical protein
MPKQKSSTVAIVLKERGQRYGAFFDHAIIAQSLQDAMRAAPGWLRLAPDQKECFCMLSHKIARVLNGDPNYLDSWVDCAGYIQLVIDRLEKESRDAKA